MGRTTRANEIVIRRKIGNGIEYQVLTHDDLNKMATQDIMDVADDILGAERRYYYDALTCVAGTALASGVQTDLFRTGINQPGLTFNTQAQFNKIADFHTNLFDNGKFQWGVSAIILAIEFEFSAPPAKPATIGTVAANTVGQVLDSTDNASQPSGYNPIQLQLAFLKQNIWRFHLGESQTQEQGRLFDVPSSNGESGFAGGGTTFCLVQNSMGGYSVALRKAKFLESQEPFFIRCISKSALAIPVDLIGWMRLDTLAIAAVEIPDPNPQQGITVVDGQGMPFSGR